MTDFWQGYRTTIESKMLVPGRTDSDYQENTIYTR